MFLRQRSGCSNDVIDSKAFSSISGEFGLPVIAELVQIANCCTVDNFMKNSSSTSIQFDFYLMNLRILGCEWKQISNISCSVDRNAIEFLARI